MSVPGDSPIPDPIEDSVTPKRTLRPYRGGVVALLAGVGMALMAFLPWLSSPFGEDPSGWDLFDAARDAGENPLYTTEFFVDQFSPFFSGLAAIISGVLMFGAALVVMLAPKVPQPAKTTVPTAWAFPAQLAGFIALASSLVGLYTLGVVQRNPKVIDPGVGLFLWFALAAIGFVALIIACAGTGARKTRS